MAEILDFGIDPARMFYNFVKDFKLFGGGGGLGDPVPLTPEDELASAWNYADDFQYGEDGEGQDMIYVDLLQKANDLGLLDQYIQFAPQTSVDTFNSLSPDYPKMTAEQIQSAYGAVDEIIRRVTSGQIDEEQGKSGVMGVLDAIGIPYDKETLEYLGGLNDKDGILSKRVTITENPNEAVAGGAAPASGEIVDSVLGGGGGGSSSGGSSGGSQGDGSTPTSGTDDSQPGTEEQWVYMGDGIFKNTQTGQETFYEPATTNPAYEVGGTYSQALPEDTTPGTTSPGETDNTGPFDITDIVDWVYQGNGVFKRPNGDTANISDYPGFEVPDGINVGDTVTVDDTGTIVKVPDTGTGPGTGPGDGPGDGPDDGPGAGPGTGPGTVTNTSTTNNTVNNSTTNTSTTNTTNTTNNTYSTTNTYSTINDIFNDLGQTINDNRSTNVALMAMGRPQSTIAEIFKPEIRRLQKADISDYLALSRNRRV